LKVSPNAASVKVFDNEGLSITGDMTLLARMYAKLGPLSKFEQILQKAFQSCIAGLRDDNPWNDQDTLRQLCSILACLPGLEEDASIVRSAQFYTLDKSLEEKLRKQILNLYRDEDGA
jgi:hypothetical protein